jgi:hypothetical protein
MLHPPTPVFERLLAGISALPVVDCHEHMGGPQFTDPGREPIAALIGSYLGVELMSAGADRATFLLLRDPQVSTERKWPIFQPLWQHTQHTAYGRVTRLILRDVYGEPEMSLAALHHVAEQLAERDEASYWRTLDQAHIRLVLTDVLGINPPGDFGKYLRGEQTFPDRFRLLISLPLFHVVAAQDNITHDWVIAGSARDWYGVQQVGQWADCHITSLDEFLEAVFEVMQQAKARGAVGLKDQCAYVRSLDYELVPRCDAERIFNQLLADPRAVLGWPAAKPLDDFLFHEYMRFARELHLPVQLHTGHMAGVFNRVEKANAAHLSRVMELHQGVRFDLFHGNWPYMDDLLFLAKNYPNMAMDCCWLHIIDPLYAQELLKRSVVTVPHGKVHGFGGDYHDMPEYSAAHLQIARHVIAATLTDLVEQGWLDEAEALPIAADWLYNNPNVFFKLGLESIRPS